MSSVTLLLAVLLVLETAALVVLAILYRKARKESKVRRVEAPNSEFRSPYVEDLDAKERWERMDLESLHEVNREEVESLLKKVRSDGIRSLSDTERAFLDRMAEAAARAQGDSDARDVPGSARELPGTS